MEHHLLRIDFPTLCLVFNWLLHLSLFRTWIIVTDAIHKEWIAFVLSQYVYTLSTDWTACLPVYLRHEKTYVLRIQRL